MAALLQKNISKSVFDNVKKSSLTNRLKFNQREVQFHFNSN